MENPKFRKALPYVVVVVVVVVFAALLIVGSPHPPQTLYPSEVRNYQGEDLSLIAQVYENAIAGTQFIDQATYHLNITGLVDSPLQLTYSDVLDFPRYQKVVTIYCVDGWSAKILWEGVLVKDLLNAAGAHISAPVVIFYASDGYSTALPLDYIINNDILLAYKMNNVTIPPERGFPFELVAESQYGYKWIKWLTQIEVSDNAGYLGYWERRGYPNNATLR
ncbi:MAG: molybdopterin-dependent oxidoreductase [Candidatus Bathyarchaeota archaeon]|nr:molybdopterin-dependent oxidoreductase [Candidatus Bathyarchaeota archaeon]